MPYRGERPLLRRMVISLSPEILNYLRASPFIACPEAEAYANQDITPQREFFHLSAPQYKKPCEPSPETPPITKIEWKILTLAKKNLSREEIWKNSVFPGKTSASDCSFCAPDLTIYPPFSTNGRYGKPFSLTLKRISTPGTPPRRRRKSG